jgi:hypothetical protein
MVNVAKGKLTTLLQLYLHLQTIRLSNLTRLMVYHGAKEGYDAIKVVEIVRPPVVGVLFAGLVIAAARG